MSTHHAILTLLQAAAPAKAADTDATLSAALPLLLALGGVLVVLSTLVVIAMLRAFRGVAKQNGREQPMIDPRPNPEATPWEIAGKRAPANPIPGFEPDEDPEDPS